MRRWIRRIVLGLAVLVVLASGFQLWNVSRQVARLWDYVLQPPAAEVTGEVAALRAQLEVMRQYDQRLLETVYWALAVIVVIAALLVGFGWYANFRVYERDKAVMQQDLRNVMQAAIAEARQALAGDIRKVAEEAGSKVARELSGKIDRVAAELGGIQYEREMEVARRWEKVIIDNALSHYIEAAEVALDRRVTIPLALENALDGIVRVFEGGAHADSYYLRRLKPVLDRLPATHADSAKKIRSLAGIPT